MPHGVRIHARDNVDEPKALFRKHSLWIPVPMRRSELRRCRLGFFWVDVADSCDPRTLATEARPGVKMVLGEETHPITPSRILSGIGRFVSLGLRQPLDTTLTDGRYLSSASSAPTVQL
jgi:hypothetical protein